MKGDRWSKIAIFLVLVIVILSISVTLFPDDTDSLLRDVSRLSLLDTKFDSNKNYRNFQLTNFQCDYNNLEYACYLDYYNNLEELKALFLVSDSKGKVVQRSVTDELVEGQGTNSFKFICSGISDKYKVSWWIFHSSDKTFSDPISWSKPPLMELECK
ncbi:MAG: hypothetical protein GF368_05955 [Candidatus Aenigmarchaeota archaeon]|nr:hypothetical protein [Candidatus Aenigmarchaeota archaeon]